MADRYAESFRYAFGPFVADPVKRTLWRDGNVVPITAKTFDVLLVLLERRDGLVSKDELLDRVWPNTSVGENNLVRQISSLRKALGQRPDQHDYVVTIPGQGYRFVASVLERSPAPLEADPAIHIDPEGPTDLTNDLEDSSDAEPPIAAADAAEPDPGRSASAKGPWASVAIVLGVTSGLLATALIVTIRRVPGTSSEPRRTLQRITYDEAAVPRQSAWSPDGRWLVYVSDRAGNADVWKLRLGDPDPVRVTSSDAHESQPAWSPDGGSIVFRSERDGGGLYVMPSSGGVERLVASFGYEPRWSQDGKHILFKRSAVIPDLPNLYVVGLDGKPPRPLRPDVLDQFSALHAAWHPDGQRVSIWGKLSSGEMAFHTVSLEAGRGTASAIARHVQQDFATLSPGRFVWAPSRRHIYFEGRTGDTRNVWRVTVDPRTEAWTDGPERLTTGASEETSLAISPDGARLVFTATASRTRLWAFPLDPGTGRLAGQPTPITDDSMGEVDFDARADGSKVAYRTVRGGRGELWERSMVDSQERRLLSSPEWRFVKPRWSPDGERLAFSRYAVGDHTLAVSVINADGRAERVVTTPGEVEMQASDWSRDGQAILGACRFSRSDRYSTCLVPAWGANAVDRSSVRVVASDPKRNLYNQRFSPDQRWVAFLAHDLLYAATSTVYVVPAVGGAWRAITDGTWFDDKPRWGPDGRIIYFVSNRSGMANVWGRRFDSALGTPAGDAFPVTTFRSPQFQLTPRTVQMDIAITATHLLLPMTESRSNLWLLDRVDR